MEDKEVTWFRSGNFFGDGVKPQINKVKKYVLREKSTTNLQCISNINSAHEKTLYRKVRNTLGRYDTSPRSSKQNDDIP